MKDWKQRYPGTKTLAEAIEKLSKQPSDSLINPKKHPFVKNLKEAVDFFLSHIDEKITIVGDYDVDGITSSSILFMGIKKKTGKEPVVRLPKRFSEGYGLSMKIIDEIDEGLVITVDNGITAVEQVKAAKEKGLDVIVIDHHLANESGILPCADVILDPKAVPGSEFADYCGAGLAYRFVEEIIPDDPLLKKLVALAGIGTVADVMPLIGDNRNLVKESLAMVRKRNVTDGLEALLEAAGLEQVDAETYGYQIGPILNASGRLHDDGAMRGFELLTKNNDNGFIDDSIRLEYLDAAKAMVKTNEERKKLVKESMERAKEAFRYIPFIDPPVIHYDPECSEGIIGIVAGQLCEDYNMPAIVFTDSGTEGILKGSGRSVSDVHLKKLLDKCSKYLIGYGGHAGAAGLSIKKEDLGKFTDAIRYALKWYRPKDKAKLYDIALTPEQVPGMIRELKAYEPFGEGVPEPVFLVEGFVCAPRKDGKGYRIIGQTKEHLKLFGSSVNAVGFYLAEQYRKEKCPDTVDIIGQLGQNEFNGTVYDQIEMMDFARTEKKETGKMSLEEFLVFH